MSISNYLENVILDHILRNQAYTPAGTVYASLHTADPGETGTSEVTGGSYARQAIAFAAASGGTVSNSGTLNFTVMPAGTVTHMGLWDALSSGNFLWSGAATAPKTLNAGDTYQIAPNDFDVTLD